jgi:hypothetical protein
LPIVALLGVSLTLAGVGDSRPPRVTPAPKDRRVLRAHKEFKECRILRGRPERRVLKGRRALPATRGTKETRAIPEKVTKENGVRKGTKVIPAIHCAHYRLTAK